jgi:hypothetical protein
MRIIFEATEIRTGDKVKGNYIFYKGHNEHFTHAIQVLNDKKEVVYVATIDEATLKIIHLDKSLL